MLYYCTYNTIIYIVLARLQSYKEVYMNDYISYLVDVLGYREYELLGLSTGELQDIIDTEGSLQDFQDFITCNRYHVEVKVPSLKGFIGE